MPTSADAKSIFGRALELSLAADRIAYLEEACGDDTGLRAEVEGLLKALERAGPFMNRPAISVDPGIPGATEPAIGTMIGPYTLLQRLGEGGMGLVYLAQQEQPVKRRVALKIIKAGMDSRQVIARFEQEREALALMDHPNIARVLDAGTTDGEPACVGAGRPYVVMELVKGIPITRFSDQERLTLRERLELFIPVCHAVQHAHQKGIIHRDLKPSNVLIAPYDGQPVPKIIDFGVAKAIGRTLTERSVFTEVGVLVGTLEYMAPEQAEMNNLDIDTRADIYSLGVILYELLTGAPPFTSEQLRDAGFVEMLRLVKEVEPPKPSTKLSSSDELPSIAASRKVQPRALTKLMTGELDWIVMKCLEKERGRRYETATNLALDLHRYLADEPVQACPPSAGYRLRKFARRNKTRLAIAAAVFLAGTVMAASIGWAVRDRAARHAQIEQAETARWAKVEGQARDSLDMARTLIAENKLASARDKLARARTQLGNDASVLATLAVEVEATEAELDRFQQFLELIDRAHEAETAPLLQLTLAVGSDGSAAAPAPVRIAGRRPAAAVSFLLEALQRYDVLNRDDWHSTLGGSILGRYQVEQIRRHAYEELLWLADDTLRRQQEHQSAGKLSPHAAAQQALIYLSKAESAQQPTQAFYALRARCRKALGEQAAAQADSQLAIQTPPTMALDHFLRGQAAYNADQLAEAVQAFEAALRLEPTHYWSMMKLGYYLCDLGQGSEDFGKAAMVFTGCILNRPDHAHAYLGRANANFRLHRYEVAVADSSKAIELDPQEAKTWHTRGSAYHELGERDKAVADFSRAIELDREFALAWNNRGAAYGKLGRPNEAVADFSRAIELDPTHAPAWFNRGLAHHELGQPDKAAADFSRVIELDPKHADAWNNRGLAYHNLGQPGKAASDFSTAIELNPKHVPAWFNRGLAYGMLGQLGKAAAEFSRAIELNPKHADAWYNRGFAYHKLGQRDKAVADFSKAIELDPKHAAAWFNRGSAYNKLGDRDKAVADFSKVIELAPNDRAAVAARNELAWLLATSPDPKLRDPDQAVELAKKAVQLAPKAGNYWKTLGVAHYRAGDWKAAVAALDKSRELLHGGDAVDRLVSAMAHQKLGNHDEARKAYAQALEWLETNKEALQKDTGRAEELRRFRAEAEEVLQLKKSRR